MTGKPRGRYYDITGRRYGRLVVLRKGPSRSKQTSWDCICDCGAETNVLKASLTGGRTVSCGCFMRERAAEVGASTATHGMRKSPEYSVWSGLKRRCENPNERCFDRYGGRGLRVTYAGFEEFIADVGLRPSRRHQIDRIDNERGYEPGNCRWARPERQARNKRNTLRVTYRGRTACLADFCEDLDLPYQRTWARIRQLGWSVERAFR